MNICQIDECAAKAFGGGYCNRHYMQLRNHDKIVATHGRVPSDPNEFVLDDNIVWIKLYDRWGNVKAKTSIDLEDYKKVKNWKWYLDSKGYPVTNDCGKKLYLHQIITGYGKHKTDHKDRNPLNNKKGNLRQSNPSQNAMNAKSQCHSSKYKGVSLKAGKWQVTIAKNGKSHYLGRFTDEWEAALVYDEAAKKLHGKFALFNIL